MGCGHSDNNDNVHTVAGSDTKPPAKVTGRGFRFLRAARFQPTTSEAETQSWSCFSVLQFCAFNYKKLNPCFGN